jgi:uncharacterized protein
MRFAQLVMRHRILTMLLILGATTYLFINMVHISVRTSFDELLPYKNPYIKLHKEIRDKFGGANLVTLSIEVKEGNIFNPETLKKVRYLNDQLDLIPGINHYQVESVAHIRVRTIQITADGMVKFVPLIPDVIPDNPAGLAQIQRDCYVNDAVYGRLVSVDGKAALFTAGFLEQSLNYPVIFEHLQRLRHELEDDNTRIYITGPPMLYGWIYYLYKHSFGVFGASSTLVCFSITIVVFFLLLIAYFRRMVGVVAPMIGAGISAIWGIGFAGIAGYDFDPLILIVHLLVTARAISHSVQMTERFLEEYEETGDKKYSATKAMGDLFIPGMISVVTDAMGIYVVSLASIPILHRLAFFNTFWGMSIIFSVLILTPIIISFLPAPRKRERYIFKPVARYLQVMAWLSTGKASRWVVVGTAAILLIGSWNYSKKLTFGDTRPGSPLLWNDHDFNVSANAINERFAGVNHLYLIFSGNRPDIIKEPYVLRTMDKMGRYLVEVPSAGGAVSIADMAKSINKMYHYEDPKWGMIPSSAQNAGGFFFMYENGSPIPQVLSAYMDVKAEEANLAVFYKDTKRTTIDEAMERTQKFIEDNPIKDVAYRIAAGLIGVLKATNDEIEWAHNWNTIMVFSMVFYCVFASYFSPIASLLIMAPLGLATIICLCYMVFANIGMNINTLPVSAIGVGIGVDYAVYIVDRMKREYKKVGGDMDAALKKAITTTGMAVTFTVACLVGGIIFWYPLSSIRFQSEMAILLAIVMFLNGLSAVTLVPSLFSIIKPKFALEEGERHPLLQSRWFRMAVSIALAIGGMGAILLYGLSTGSHNIDREFVMIMAGLTAVMVVYGIFVQNVET